MSGIDGVTAALLRRVAEADPARAAAMAETLAGLPCRTAADEAQRDALRAWARGVNG